MGQKPWTQRRILQGFVTVNRSDMMVAYGPVEIGGRI
jgi:hypothetical protein